MYEGQCHMPLHFFFSGCAALEPEGWLRLKFGRERRLAAVVAAFVGRLPGDRGEGALEERVVYDVALVIFTFDDPVAGIGFALS